MISRILDWFEDFVAAGGMTEPTDAARVELKRQHCLMVMAEAREQAREQNLSPRMVDLATIAGLCHDTGRFPQYQRYRTFRDADSANHAILGTQALARHGVLDELVGRDRWLVRLSIMQHNRRELTPRLASGEDQEALVLTRIVRDADKLDIVRVMLEQFKTRGEKDPVVFFSLPDRPRDFSPAIVDDIEAGRIGDYGAMASTNDFALLLLSWINDMAFARTRRLYFERGYVRDLFALLPDQPRIAGLKAHIHDRFAPRSVGP